MSPAIISAIIGAITTALGWFTLDLISRRRDNAARRTQVAVEFIKRQIDELYGPLLGLIRQSTAVYGVMSSRMTQGGRGIDLKSLDHDQAIIWNYFTETYFLPSNRKIVDLIVGRQYLISGDAMPESYRNFIEHAAQFEGLHGLWKSTGIGSTSIEGAGWPKNFESDVATELERLKREYHTYRERIPELERRKGRE